MNIRSSSSKDADSFNISFFRVRMLAKLCIVAVCAFQLIPRLLVLCLGFTFNSIYARNMAISLSFLGGMIIMVAIEYILFKKRGKKIIKYSNLVDLIILILFLCDWIGSVVSSFQMVRPTDPPSFKISALYAYTVFAWRTLLVTLIVQKWYLKALPPAIAISVATGYAIHYEPDNLAYNLIRAIAQIMTMTIIFYFENKLTWKMMWMNLQQEKWIQMNNFILNNLPENIMILTAQGEVKFISDYCKSFMEDCNFSLTHKTRDFFNKIHHLHQLQTELAPSFQVIDFHRFYSKSLENRYAY